MVRRLGLGKKKHLTYASLALNPRYVKEFVGHGVEQYSLSTKVTYTKFNLPLYYPLQPLQSHVAATVSDRRSCVHAQ